MSIREPNRDQAIDALLREPMRAGAAAAPFDRCLDADTLAAWIDGDLKPADVAAAEAHVSSCARCQSMIAALVRATPAVPQTTPWWRRRWVIGSLVPLTAGALAIAIWIASPDIARAPESARADARAQAVAAAPPAQEPAVPPSVDKQSRAAIAPQESSALRDRVSTPPARDAQAKAENRARESDERNEAIAAPRYDAPTAAPMTAASPMASRATPAGAPVAGSSAPAVAAAPPPPVAAPEAARQAFEARDAIAANQMVAKHAVVPVEVRSPNPSTRWRVGAAGSIERSGNGGATWTASPSGVTEDLTAGAAPSPTVCWVVGRRGTVLLSIDGLQWRRVAFPGNSDLAAVQASDTSSATVTTSDNRRFRTADGGQTWTPLQEF